MRFNTPSMGRRMERFLGILLAIVLSPLWVPTAILFATLMWLHEAKRRILGPSSSWEIWFAWYPVYVRSYHINDKGSWQGSWVWLETIQRKADHVQLLIEYRFLKGDYN